MRKGNKEALVQQGRPLVLRTPEALMHAFGRVKDSLEEFCLRAGLESLEELMACDVRSLCGERQARAVPRRRAPAGGESVMRTREGAKG